jgi:hypothetical protein
MKLPDQQFVWRDLLYQHTQHINHYLNTRSPAYIIMLFYIFHLQLIP